MMALVLAWALAAQDAGEKKVDLENLKLFVYDAAKGLKLRVQHDGKVELSVSEDGKPAQTWSAPNAEEFSRKHPEVVRKYGLEKHLGSGAAQDPFDRLWEDLRRPRFRGLPEDDVQKLLQESLRQMEELQKRFRRLPVDPAPEPAPAPGGREFGVKIDPVGETLRDQLSLKEGEGIVVGSVKPGSIAEKAGLKTYDVILKVDGKAVVDKWQFRTDVLDALGKAEFELEVVRGGKRETLKVKPPARKDE